MENNFKYKRIIILGGSGAGKSTLASRIGQYTGYPIYHLDNILLNSDWSEKPRKEWEDICQKEFLLRDVGVVDGNYLAGIQRRLDWADLVIFIHTTTMYRMYQIFKRNIRIKLRVDKRFGIPEGSKEKVTWKFIVWIFKWNKYQKDKIFPMLESLKDKKVVIIKEPRKLNLEELFK